MTLPEDGNALNRNRFNRHAQPTVSLHQKTNANKNLKTLAPIKTKKREDGNAEESLDRVTVRTLG